MDNYFANNIKAFKSGGQYLSLDIIIISLMLLSLSLTCVRGGTWKPVINNLDSVWLVGKKGGFGSL